MRFLNFHILPLWILIALPSPTGYVNDFAGVLKPETKQSLENLIVQFEKETSIELAIVTVQTLEGMTVEDYAVRLFENWRIGKKEKDNGLLFLVAPNERKARIEVGYGLEGTLNDAQAARILREYLVPFAKEGNFNEGIQGTAQILYRIFAKKEQGLLGEPKSKTLPIWFYILLFFLVWELFSWRRVRRLSRGWYWTGSGGGFHGGFGGSSSGGGGVGGFGGGSSGGGGGSASW